MKSEVPHKAARRSGAGSVDWSHFGHGRADTGQHRLISEPRSSNRKRPLSWTNADQPTLADTSSGRLEDRSTDARLRVLNRRKAGGGRYPATFNRYFSRSSLRTCSHRCVEPDCIDTESARWHTAASRRTPSTPRNIETNGVKHMAFTTRSRALLASLSVGALLLTVGTTTAHADPSDGSQVVSTTHGHHHLSWHTPGVQGQHASIASKSDNDSATSIITLKDAIAPSSYSFQVDVPAGFQLIATSDGGVDVAQVAADATYVVGHVDTPWAKDATGKQLNTSFTVSGNTLTQKVSTAGAKFPVTADPHYTWGWVTGTVYYNRAETRSLKTASAAAAAAAGICAFFGAETLGAACVAAGVFYGQWLYVASNAYSDGNCIQIKVPTMWASAYSGGYCK